MSRINRGVMALAVSSALVGGALIGPSMASAKSVKATCHIPDNVLKGTKLGGSVSCKGLGKGTIKGKQSGYGAPPVLRIVWTFKGGTVKASVKDGHIVGATVLGTAKVTGTGKYKKLKGKATLKGGLASNIYDFKITGTM